MKEVHACNDNSKLGVGNLLAQNQRAKVITKEEAMVSAQEYNCPGLQATFSNKQVFLK